MRLQNLALATSIAVASAQNATVGNDTTSSNTSALATALAGNPNLTVLASILAMYPSLLSSGSNATNATNVTVLAPSNDALTALINSPGYLNNSGPEVLEPLLQYHILDGTYLASNITNMSQVLHTSLENPNYTNVTGGQYVNAIVYGGNVTFFSGLKNNSTVTQANITFSGGVIHVIDRVLTLPGNVSTTASEANLTAFAGAIEAVNATSMVDYAQDVTIFAPSNDAFQAIGSALGNLSTADLLSILEYHIVNDTVQYFSTLANATYTASNGETLTGSKINDTFYINGAKVINPDIPIANGVLHVIDAVLNPNDTSQTAVASASRTPEVAFSGASSATDVPFTSGVATPSSSVAAQGSATTTNAAATSTGAAAAPLRTGAVGAAALFGGAVLLANL